MKNKNVSLRACENYENENVKIAVNALFDDISLDREEICGKNVVIKPNLVRKMDIGAAGTTNPTVVAEIAKIFVEMGAKSVKIAESPAGVYTENSIRSSYRAGRMDTSAEESGAELNFDMSSRRISSAVKERSRTFNIITPIADADVIVNICKLKTHNLTGMSGAVKNFFGVIPGTEKLEMHALYPNLADFSLMLCDLCKTICEGRTVINVMDAVIGMEGNGPTNGRPKKLGFLGCSRDPFSLDMAAAYIIGMESLSSISEAAKKQGFESESLDSVPFFGDSKESLVCKDFVLPDSADRRKSGINILTKLFGGKFIETLRPRPVISNEKCVGCGECMRACPARTIVIKDAKAHINKKDCIKCFCCQELCPKDAVKVKKNIIFAIVH